MLLPLLLLSLPLALTHVVPIPSRPRHLQARAIEVPSFSTLIPIPTRTINLVRARSFDGSKASWELGAMAQAFLEIDWPWLSVFGSQGVHPPRSATGTNNITSVLGVADYALAITPPNILPLFQDPGITAAGDPPAIGIATLLANWTKSSRPNAAQNNYDGALRRQLNYILEVAPKTADGAISHRAEQVQLWSDFVYMVPPFIAYYAALYQPSVHSWLLNEAYHQIKLYRGHLFDNNLGLWKHIVYGTATDDGAWTTGNGWAAMGMLRVLVTINQTTLGYQPEFQAAQADLLHWSSQIVNNIWKYQKRNGTLFNYPDRTNSFADSSGTAIMAAVTYRLAAIGRYLRGPPSSPRTNLTMDTPITHESLQSAHRARDLIIKSLHPSDGWLQNVANPWSYSQRGEKSPEGQSFVLMMESAWRVWIDTVTD